MKKASEYVQHAEQCRRLARTVEGEHRDQLLQMAATWDCLAEQRAELISRHPELSTPETEPISPEPVRAAG